MKEVTGLPTLPSSATDPPHPSRRGTHSAFGIGVFWGFFTFLSVFGIVSLFSLSPCYVSFSVQSVSVSLSSYAMWHVDFHVKNPSSFRCLIYYNGDDAHAKLGSLNAAVLKTSSAPGSSGRKIFSVDLATKGNNYSDVVVAASPRVYELDLKLSAKKNMYMLGAEYGHFKIMCRNLTIGFQKIKCHSSFNKLNPYTFTKEISY